MGDSLAPLLADLREEYGVEPDRPASLRVGDCVQLVAEMDDGFREAFWVRVTELRGRGRFRGEVSNPLVCSDEHGRSYGDALDFEARHVGRIRYRVDA